MPETVLKVAELVKAKLSGEGSGHDWEHIERVWKTIQKLAQEENADIELAELAALLHDVDDAKLTGDLTTEKTLPTAYQFMREVGLPEPRQEQVANVIRGSGYHKSLDGQGGATLEQNLLSDADYLDAIGAIGIARCFAYGGYKSRPIFIPGEAPRETISRADYVSTNTNSVNHFFEKLLRLKDKMVTRSGKTEAAKRHSRMVRYIEDFFEEVGAPAEWAELLKPYRS
jgi:uncharacterized protein